MAAATGNVTNQAVQFQNNGAPSRQYFSGNNSCNGTTMQLSPFYMGNDTTPMNPDSYIKNNNWGAQVSLSIPLDGGMIETCKGIARKHEAKMRLDYELVRALKCTEIMQKGFTFRPGSRVEVLCNDTHYHPHDIAIGQDRKGILLYGINSSGKSTLMKRLLKRNAGSAIETISFFNLSLVISIDSMTSFILFKLKVNGCKTAGKFIVIIQPQ